MLAGPQRISLTQAHFVPNFVAMATGVDRGKMRLAAFDGLSPKIPPIGAKISQKSFTQAELLPILSHISLPWQPGEGKENGEGKLGRERRRGKGRVR